MLLHSYDPAVRAKALTKRSGCLQHGIKRSVETFLEVYDRAEPEMLVFGKAVDPF